jgi:hypothetical protein
MRFRSRLRKCTSRMIGILTMHVSDSTSEYPRKSTRFDLRFYTRLDKNAGLKKEETHDPY